MHEVTVKLTNEKTKNERTKRTNVPQNEGHYICQSVLRRNGQMDGQTNGQTN